jgi:hypothetical protein
MCQNFVEVPSGANLNLISQVLTDATEVTAQVHGIMIHIRDHQLAVK